MANITNVKVIRKEIEGKFGKYEVSFETVGSIILDFYECFHDVEINGCKGYVNLEKFIIGINENGKEYFKETIEEDLLNDPNNFFTDDYEDDEYGFDGLIVDLYETSDIDKFANCDVRRLYYRASQLDWEYDSSIVLTECKDFLTFTIH